MRQIDLFLNEYGESHQNETNKLVHWFAVPVIVWTVLALLWSIPASFLPFSLNWCYVFGGLSILYYCYLSLPLAVAMALFFAVCVSLIKTYSGLTSFPLWQFALIVFVVAWAAQFWGHKVEGKKPSFFKDIQFLLIGPAWLFSFLFKKAGIKY